MANKKLQNELKEITTKHCFWIHEWGQNGCPEVTYKLFSEFRSVLHNHDCYWFENVHKLRCYFEVQTVLGDILIYDTDEFRVK